MSRRLLLTLSLFGCSATEVPARIETEVSCSPCESIGDWSPVAPWPSALDPIVAIHTSVLPDGRVISFSRQDHDMHFHTNDIWIWDPITETAIARPLAYDDALGADLFCSGHSFLADGRLLVSAGHWRDGYGVPFANIFDWRNDRWRPAQPMAFPDLQDRSNDRESWWPGGRWYPSNVSLPTGEVLVIGGTVRPGRPNRTPQVYRLDGSWRDLTSATDLDLPDSFPYYYPFIHVAPNGRLFQSGPQRGARYLDPNGTGAWSTVISYSRLRAEGSSNATYELVRDYGSSLIYQDRAGHMQVMNAGGGNIVRVAEGNRSHAYVNANASVETIDLSETRPDFQSAGDMIHARRHFNTVILPTGEIMAIGGTSGRDCIDCTEAEIPGRTTSGELAVFETEIWNPNSRTWRAAASLSVQRLYHSTAVLLPDGRVLAAGGGLPNHYNEPNCPNGCPHKDAQIYSPSYLFNDDGTRRSDAERPQIRGAPASIAYGQTFFVSASGGSEVVLIRLPSVTHSYNEENRLVRPVAQTIDGGLLVTLPARVALEDGTLVHARNICPPGHYLMFVIGDGIPSKAKIIRVDGFDSLGGAALARPAAAAWGSDRLEIALRGGGDEIYRGWIDRSEGTFSGWASSELRSVSNGTEGVPAIVAFGTPANGQLHLFARAVDNGIFHQRRVAGRSPGAWTHWPGATLSDPIALAWGDQIEVFVRGTDQDIYHISYSPLTDQFHRWEALQLNATLPNSNGASLRPAVVAFGTPAEGRLELFVRGADAGIYHRSFVGGSWQQWTQFDGWLESEPSAVRIGDRVEIVVAGAGFELYRGSYEPLIDRWNGWAPEGLLAATGHAAAGMPVVSGDDGRFDLAVRGADGALYHRYEIDGARVSGWEQIGSGSQSDPVPLVLGGEAHVFVNGTNGDPRYLKLHLR